MNRKTRRARTPVTLAGEIRVADGAIRPANDERNRNNDDVVVIAVDAVHAVAGVAAAVVFPTTNMLSPGLMPRR